MDEPGAAGVGQELRPVAEQAACRNLEGEPHHPHTRIAHLQHFRTPRPELLHDDAHVLLGDVDGELLVRLQPLAVRPFAQDDPRARYLELVPFAPHRLHQDAEVQLAAARHGVRVGRIGRLDPERHVPLQLLEEPVAHLARW